MKKLVTDCILKWKHKYLHLHDNKDKLSREAKLLTNKGLEQDREIEWLNWKLDK